MKVLYIVNNVCYEGGIARTIINKANYFVRNFGWEVVIVQINQPQPMHYPLDPRVANINLNLPIFGKPPVERITNTLKVAKAVKCLLKEHKPDITVTLQYLKELFWLTRYKAGGKKVVESHGNRNSQMPLNCSWKRKILNKLSRHQIVRADAFVVLTHRDRLAYVDTLKAKVIPNAAPNLNMEAHPEKNKLVIAVGRLDRFKNFGNLIEIWDKVHGRFPEWRLLICGRGPENDNLKEQIKRLGIESNVTVSFEKDMCHIYSQAAIMASVSLTEGLPMALLEAANCQLPIVAYDCDCGPSELIDDGVTGYVIPKWDSELFARRLTELMTDEELRHKMGQAAIAKMKREYSDEVVMAKWEKLFEELI